MKTFKMVLSVLFAALLLAACTKEYSSESYLGPKGSWEFMNGTSKYSGSLNEIHQNSGLGTQSVSVKGKSDNGSRIFQLSVSTSELKPGTYLISLGQCAFSYTDNSGKTIYQANKDAGEFTITILTIGTEKITGTFSGTVIDESSNAVEIASGKFTVE